MKRTSLGDAVFMICEGIVFGFVLLSVFFILVLLGPDKTPDMQLEWPTTEQETNRKADS